MRKLTTVMDEQLTKQQQTYDRTWLNGLEAGKEQRGNLDVNLEFLNESDLISSDDRILEIGCGIGTIVYELSKRGCKTVGTDISNRAIEYGQKKYPSVELKVEAGQRMSFADNSFDVVLSFDVLEHIDDVDRHLSEVARVLVAEGYYLLQTPNKYFNAVFETIRKRSLKWRKYHPSLHTAGQLKRRFDRCGFNIRFVKMNTINDFTLKKINSSWIRDVVGKIKFEKMPLFLQTNFYVVAQKR